ncbi:MAG TPA: hypothetical protein VHF90_02475 [Thermoleophilaceae bacterium]|nr:hypothetical protein [Thermoleophilaceae bacterium]
MDNETTPSQSIQLQPFYCPFDEVINPAVAEIEAHCVDWIDRFGLYQTSAQRERLIGTRAAEIYSRALPGADPERVADVAKWLYWGFATDDLIYDNGPTSVRSADFLAVAVRLARISEEPRARFSSEPPYTDALRDLVQAIRRHATSGQLLDWADTARAWFFGMAWDVANAERGAPPALNDYLTMRMHTGGLASWATSLNIANGIELTPDQVSAPAMRALGEAWCTFALLLNDFMSYAKETKNGDNSSNIISVVANERSCRPNEAVEEAYAICDRIASLFLDLRARLLPEADDALRRHIGGLEHSWRGILDWGFRTNRYRTGGTGSDPVLQEFPGWATQPTDGDLRPLPYPAISWWWEELHESALAMEGVT